MHKKEEKGRGEKKMKEGEGGGVEVERGGRWREERGGGKGGAAGQGEE